MILNAPSSTASYSSLALTLQVADRATYRHGQRVGLLAALLGATMGLSGAALFQLRVAASLHDIGKLALPPGLLRKNGSFDRAEYRAVQCHAAFGAFLLECSRARGALAQAARHHHERWDGRGYPFGLSGRDIPLAAQITSVADAYEAMTSDRSYRQALEHGHALEELVRERGRQFSPDAVDAFLLAQGEVAGSLAGLDAPDHGASVAA